MPRKRKATTSQKGSGNAPSNRKRNNVSDSEGLCAYFGKRKYGKAGFEKLARGNPLTNDQAQALNLANDQDFRGIAESFGFEVAGPSLNGSYLIHDRTDGKAWLFSAMRKHGRTVVSSVWSELNISRMEGARGNPKGLKKSKGHLLFVGDYEYYKIGNEIYKAHKDSIFDVLGGFRQGRWEMSASRWDWWKDNILHGLLTGMDSEENPVAIPGYNVENPNPWYTVKLGWLNKNGTKGMAIDHKQPRDLETAVVWAREFVERKQKRGKVPWAEIYDQNMSLIDSYYGSERETSNPSVWRRKRGKAPSKPKAVTVEQPTYSGGLAQIIDAETGKVVKKGNSYQIGLYLKDYEFPNPSLTYEFGYMKEGKFIQENLTFDTWEKAQAKAKKLSLKYPAYSVSVSNMETAKPYYAEYKKGSRINTSERMASNPRSLGEWLRLWRETGRIAFHYPRKHTVSLNGGKAIPEKEAIERIKAFFEREKVMRTERGPRDVNTTRNVGIGEGIMLGLGSAIGGTIGSAVAEPLVSRFKRSLKGYLRNNPSTIEKATKMAEEFHGRSVEDIILFEDVYKYNDALAGLGKLVELHILCSDGKYTQPITFNYDNEDETIHLAAGNFTEVDGKMVAHQLYMIGGDQEIPFEKLLDICGYDSDSGKQYVDMGPIHELTYFADKHHLEGPEWQKKGGQYFHKLGEESGAMPVLVYDSLNKQMLLVGGNYRVEDVGIID